MDHKQHLQGKYSTNTKPIVGAGAYQLLVCRTNPHNVYRQCTNMVLVHVWYQDCLLCSKVHKHAKLVQKIHAIPPNCGENNQKVMLQPTINGAKCES